MNSRDQLEMVSFTIIIDITIPSDTSNELDSLCCVLFFQI